MDIELVSNDYNGSIVITHKQEGRDRQDFQPPPHDWTCQVNWMFQCGFTHKRYLQVTTMVMALLIHFIVGQF